MQLWAWASMILSPAPPEPVFFWGITEETQERICEVALGGSLGDWVWVLGGGGGSS